MSTHLHRAESQEQQQRQVDLGVRRHPAYQVTDCAQSGVCMCAVLTTYCFHDKATGQSVKACSVLHAERMMLAEISAALSALEVN